MPTNVKVCINGFVLSTLLFDCTNNSGDQEGFLYGSITRNVRREISDQSMSNTQEDILISICSSVPCGSFLSFYNNVGEIKREDLEYNLGERVENIVGWYRFRRYSAMFPSAREQAIHRNLRTLFANFSNVDSSYFVFGLLSSSNLPNYATHSYDYGFFIQKRDGSFRDLPLTILNLGDTRNSYRAGSMALPFMNSSSFNSVLSSSWNFRTFYESENQIHQFHQRLRTKLDSLQEELAASDAVNASLEDDIRRLSNEMQTLLVTQERLANAARELELAAANATRELELAEASGRDEAEASEKEEAEASEREEVEKNERGAAEASEVEVSEENERGLPEVTEKQAAMSNKIEMSDWGELKVIDTAEKEMTEINKIGVAVSPERETTESQEQDSSDSKESEPVIHKGSEPIDSMDDDSGDSGSSGANEKAGGSPCLKRASAEPIEDDRSTKRACLDKYFESGEYVDDKSVTSTVDDATSSGKQEDSALSSSQLLVVDPDSGEMSSAQNEGDNLKSEITSGEIEESGIPSPASNVEIVISDAGLQSFGSAMIVDETISSSDELSDNKELDAKKAVALPDVEESSNVFNIRKSLSDSAISCRKEVISGRCGSAHAEILSQVTASAVKDDKLVFGEGVSASRATSLDESKINPPFIIYASKESEDKSKDPVPPSFIESHQEIDEPKAEGLFVGEPGVERNQSSPSRDEKDEIKVVPGGSDKKEK